MNRKIASGLLAASILGGASFGAFAAPPMAAFAADSSTVATADATARTPGQWITDALKGLVSNGTISQAQSDTIASTLQAAEPKGRFGHGPLSLSEVASVLGVSEEELRTQLQTKSMADIAKEKGIDVQKVIDTLVPAENARLDQAVAGGVMTQAEADQRKADVVSRVTDQVNNVGPGRGPKRTLGLDNNGVPADTTGTTAAA